MKLHQPAIALGLLGFQAAARVVPGAADTSQGQEVHWKRSMEDFDTLTVGQGFNTLLNKGRKHEAVLVQRKEQRDVSAAPYQDEGADLLFKFTEPRADLTGLDLVKYFKPIDVDASIAQALAEQEEDKDEDEDETKAKARGEAKTMDRALDARDGSEPNCYAEVKFETRRTEDYESYLKVLGVNAAAAIEGYGQSASFSGSFLDRSELSKNTITYVGIVEIRHQPELAGTFTFNTDGYNSTLFAAEYGNRWVDGFYQGGRMIARMTFTSKKSSNKQELKTAVEAALNGFGMSGKLSASVNSSIEAVQENSDTKISFFYQGAVGHVLSTEAADTTTVFAEAKAKIDKFRDTACAHKYKYMPILNRYENVGNFPRDQKVLSYKTAEKFAKIVLENLVKCQEMSTQLKKMDHLDRERKQDIQYSMVEMMDRARRWVKETAIDPSNAATTSREVLNFFNARFLEKYQDILQPQRWISDIQVKYGKEYSDQAIQEVNGLGNDINQGFGGDYVYIIPVYTHNHNDACVQIDMISSDRDLSQEWRGFRKTQDLFSGAGGTYRHLSCIRAAGRKMTKLGLLRGVPRFEDYMSNPHSGFHGGSGVTNLNSGRGSSADALHLIWSFD